ncbi:MAG: PilZ domain-containing protein [Bradyrhizobium sp.]|nr:MAG: PilZ domain-containing protein [Bradyrhizobium sp.]
MVSTRNAKRRAATGVAKGSGDVLSFLRSSASSAKKSGGFEQRDPAERRCEPRHRVRLQSGRILDPRCRPICNCVIRDLSKGGARLLTPPTAEVSNNILFFDDQKQQMASAEVRWRKGQEMGIQFAR